MAGTACVIYNPAAGRGRAKKLLDRVRAWADPAAELMPTREPGHAVELARKAARAGYAKVIAAGGDGTVHEVANGVLEADRPGTVFAVWPLGSSNDYADTLGLRRWFKSRGREVALVPKLVDVGQLVRPGRQLHFVNCMGLGFNGMLALESRKIASLRGLPLYTVAFVRAMLGHYSTPAVAMTLDDATRDRPTLSASVNLGRREGGFPITGGALLDDGLFDAVWIGGLKRWQLLRYLPNLILGKLPRNHPLIETGTCRAARFASGQPMCVHADGEFFCTPEDGVTAFEVRMLPRRLMVEAAGPE